MQIRLLSSRLGLLNSTTRLPFRYGKACLTRCPQATLEVLIEQDGRSCRGFSGDCLPPGWFDKTPGKSFQQQLEEMCATIAASQDCFSQIFARPRPFFEGWWVAQREIHEWADTQHLPGLLAGFGVSLVERAVIDATARLHQLSFAQLIHADLLQLDAGRIHPELSSHRPADWLPAQPRSEMYVRHTVGLSDPLTDDDIPIEDRLDDHFPQSLEGYVSELGVRYLKIKVSNQLEHDLQRLETVAAIMKRHRDDDYVITLDGNEQFSDPGEFDALIERLQGNPRLAVLWKNTMVIEQPFSREIALDPSKTEGIRKLSQAKPVIIDESDEDVGSYRRALEVGYRGISSKNCKGPIRSLVNAGLNWKRRQTDSQPLVMTGEDLCSVGIIPVQSDLCLTATLGLSHVERNGHHYHPGISYLPEKQQRLALNSHSDFYFQDEQYVRPRLMDGKFQIGSLQCIGFGFQPEPDLDAMQSAQEWDFASLGL